MRSEEKSSGVYAHFTVRIPASVRVDLNREAKRRHITPNSLINAVLAKYMSFDKILEATKAIPVSEALFERWLAITSLEEMEDIAKSLGPKVVKQSFAFQGLEFNLDNLVEDYFEPLAEHSGWYQWNILDGISITRDLRAVAGS